MPLVQRKFWVVTCPKCKNRIDVNGEGGYTVFDEPGEWRVYLRESGCQNIADYCGCERRAEFRKAREARKARRVK